MKLTIIPLCLLASLTITLSACSPKTAPRPTPRELSRQQAEAALTRVVDNVDRRGFAAVCSDHVRSQEQCESLLDDALNSCLLPHDAPVVERAARVPATKSSDGGWVLEVHGRTQDGQPYVSEVQVIQGRAGQAQVELGVYWTGLGLEGSPLGPGNTVIPQDACPGKR